MLQLSVKQIIYEVWKKCNYWTFNSCWTGAEHARNLLVSNPSEIKKEELEAKLKAEQEAAEMETQELDNIE